MLRRLQHRHRGGHDGQAEQPAEREPDEGVDPHLGHALAGPAFLPAPGGEEDHLVGHDARADQGHRVEPPGRRGLPGRHRRVDGLVPQRMPVRRQAEQRHHEHDQAQAEQAEDVLHPLERHPPDHQPGGQPGQRNPDQVADPGHHLQHQGHPAELGGQRQHVQQGRGGRVDQGHPDAEPLADHVEDRLPGHRGHPAGHLGEQGHADRAHQHGPGERHAETGAGDAAGDQVPDVDEAADRRHDPERHAHDGFHCSSC